MKLLSVVVPCYNSEQFMRKAINSILAGGNRIEIIIVNDGSKDNTATIAEEYRYQYPDIIRVIHQENGGHGAAVMAGIRIATGQYIKVVDSDDWLDCSSLHTILTKLQMFYENSFMIDMVISNFIYDKVGVKHKKVMKYDNIFRENTILDWDHIGRLKKGKYLLMHSIIYRTDLLRECSLDLPRHTFYVDNLYVYLPMRWVRTMYYINTDLYHYFIGRQEQSVNETVMIKRIDQQIKVNKCMLESVDLTQIDNKTLKQFLYHHIEIVTTVSSILLLRSGTKENLEKKKDLWDFIKTEYPDLYLRLRYGLLGTMLNVPGQMGRKFAVITYKVAQRVVGFN